MSARNKGTPKQKEPKKPKSQNQSKAYCSSETKTVALKSIKTALGLRVGEEPSAGICRMSKDQFGETRRYMRMMAANLFHTQEIIMRLKLIPSMLSSSSGIFVPVYNISWANVHDNAAWATIFDEFKFLKGWIRYEPVYQDTLGISAGGLKPLAIGVIDYDDSTVINTFASANGYDTAKWFAMAPIEYRTETWDFHCQGQPDKEWQDTTAATVIPAYWKAITDAPISGSINYGRVHGEVWIQFRQVA